MPNKCTRLDRRRVGAPGRAREELTQVGHARGDVAADEVGVVRFDVGGRQDRSREDAVAEPRREALDLTLDAVEHVGGRADGTWQ